MYVSPVGKTGRNLNEACKLCKGACCEFFSLKFGPMDDDKRKWVDFHGTEAPEGVILMKEMVFFDCKCRHLKKGKCSIYDTRPNVCEDMEVGSSLCLAALKHRRSKQQQVKIQSLIARMGKE